MNPPILFTKNLVMRPPNGEDFEAWAAFNADEESMRFLGGTQSRPIAWRGLCTLAGAWMVRGYSMFSLIERDTGRWVGRIGPHQPDGWPGPEVGWGVAREFAGRGYAYEAAVASMDYAVDVLGWTDIIHTIAPDNIRSIRLAQRLGSTNRGPSALPPPFQGQPVDAWGQTADDWRARRQAASGPWLYQVAMSASGASSELRSKRWTRSGLAMNGRPKLIASAPPASTTACALAKS